ncbi:MAG TPA: hypothetical protein VEL11_11505 [Candidatus Bathyarchaeia archaeon]|nr:hypothetical protein [Candidatus Bathyarchaeia archaeon]
MPNQLLEGMHPTVRNIVNELITFQQRIDIVEWQIETKNGKKYSPG